MNEQRIITDKGRGRFSRDRLTRQLTGLLRNSLAVVEGTCVLLLNKFYLFTRHRALVEGAIVNVSDLIPFESCTELQLSRPTFCGFSGSFLSFGFFYCVHACTRVLYAVAD